eukprot:TRINITY_DN5563_c0_g1_i1.p1 TRINITY_DN5563_c0_g1~~TRINITY_DN5563_c0_g1_i1.p1  ORF type:complete len:104 (-),score=13.54 TRINITY_DN5563_c0_g1_i1:551-862(-)
MYALFSMAPSTFLFPFNKIMLLSVIPPQETDQNTKPTNQFQDQYHAPHSLSQVEPAVRNQNHLISAEDPNLNGYDHHLSASPKTERGGTKGRETVLEGCGHGK